MTDAKRITKALKTIAAWSNRANDAYAMGEADWVHDASLGPNLVAMAAYALEHKGETPDGWELAAYAVQSECKARGIDPKRHRWHPPVRP